MALVSSQPTLKHLGLSSGFPASQSWEALAIPLPGTSLLLTPAGPCATTSAKGQPQKIAQPGLDLYFPLLSQKTPPFFQHRHFPSLLSKHALFVIPGPCFMKQSWAGCLDGTGHKVAMGWLFWKPAQNKGELCQGSGEHTDRLLTQAWTQGLLPLRHGNWTPSSLFLFRLPATVFSYLDPHFINSEWVYGWWYHFFCYITHSQLLDQGGFIFS